MNLLLLGEGVVGAEALFEGAADAEVTLTGRVPLHLSRVLRASPGQSVRVGLENGPRGTARIIALSPERCRLAVALDLSDRPQRPPTDLLLAIPRPRQLARLVQHAAALGVDRLCLLRTWRVERGYLDSPRLAPEHLLQEARLGLEQAGTTRLPRIEVALRFRPFLEDRLPALLEPGAGRLLALPGAPTPLIRAPGARAARVTLAIGPERGFTPYEVERLTALDLRPVSLTPGVLRTETAVAVALGQLAAARALSSF